MHNPLAADFTIMARMSVSCIAICLSACSTFSQAGPANPEIEKTVAELIESLAENGDDTMTIGGLVTLGPQAPDVLAEGLENPDAEIRLGIVEAVAQMPEDTAVPLLLEALEDEDWEVRLAVVEALGVFRDRRAVKPLMHRFQIDDDDQVRYECLTSLGLIGDPGAGDLLVATAADSDPNIRYWAVEALCRMRHPDATRLAVQMLNDPNEFARQNVIGACGEVLNTPAAQAKLIDVALHAQRFERSVLARRALERQIPADPGLAEEMRVAGRAALNGAAAQRAALLLGDLGDPIATDQLIRLLQDPNPFIRHHAAYLLGKVGGDRAVAPLAATLQDNEPFVAATAYDSLLWLAEHGNKEAEKVVAGYQGDKFDQRMPR